MSCYFRHLRSVLEQAGVEVTPANRRQVDEAIHHIVSVTYKDCPTAWRRIKQDLLADERKRKDFIEELERAIR